LRVRSVPLENWITEEAGQSAIHDIGNVFCHFLVLCVTESAKKALNECLKSESNNLVTEWTSCDDDMKELHDYFLSD